MLESTGPEVSVDGLGPPVGGVQQHGPCTFNEVPDPLLNFAILMMGAHATEGYGLTFLLHVFLEGCVGEPTIVSMVVLEGYTHRCSKTLEGLFGFNGFLNSVTWCHVNECEVGVVVNKDGGNLVAVLG